MYFQCLEFHSRFAWKQTRLFPSRRKIVKRPNDQSPSPTGWNKKRKQCLVYACMFCACTWLSGTILAPWMCPYTQINIMIKCRARLLYCLRSVCVHNTIKYLKPVYDHIIALSNTSSAVERNCRLPHSHAKPTPRLCVCAVLARPYVCAWLHVSNT